MPHQTLQLAERQTSDTQTIEQPTLLWMEVHHPAPLPLTLRLFKALILSPLQFVGKVLLQLKQEASSTPQLPPRPEGPQTLTIQYEAVTTPGAGSLNTSGVAAPSVPSKGDTLLPSTDEEAQPATDSNSEQIQNAYRQWKEQLIRNRSWNPLWERKGIREYFAVLNDAERQEFAEHLKSKKLPLPLAEIPTVSVPTEGGRGATPESVQLHQAVLQLQRQNPALSYVEALLEASRCQSIQQGGSQP
ncbi:MAG: hypothetical protein SFY68_14635 [Candidatus Sumerlaeia bacterium]|nr:hypothetical protein [Candidatus Sumerlaeia bacterium]